MILFNNFKTHVAVIRDELDALKVVELGQRRAEGHLIDVIGHRRLSAALNLYEIADAADG